MKINTQTVRDICFAAAVTLGAWIGGLAASVYHEKNEPSYVRGYAQGRRDEFDRLYKIAHEGMTDEKTENETEEEEESEKKSSGRYPWGS